MREANPVIGPSQGMRPLTGWLLIGVAMVFGALTIDQAVSLLSGQADLKTRWLEWATSSSFVHGEGSLSYALASYQQASLRMALHMALGGVAVGLGSLQFVPWVRQHYPRWHRASGLVVWLATLVGMASAIAYLIFIPAAKGASGVAFHVGLWSLSLLTLLLLWQAVLAVWSRDFRSHMIWMALLYAALLTAPVLRIDWVALAWLRPDVGHEWDNLATGTCVLLQTLMLMALWLDRVGDRHLPGRPAPASSWPHGLVVLMCALSALGAAQEAFLAGGVADPFALWRTPLGQLPVARWLWGAATLAAMLFMPGAWRSGLAGARPGGGITAASIGVAVGALLLGLEADHGSPGRFASGTFWLGYAGVLLLALLQAWLRAANTLGRNAWLMILLGALWLPSQFNGAIALVLRIPGASFEDAYVAALTIGSGGVVALGVATGFGAKVRWRVRSRVGVQQGAGLPR